MIAELGPSCNVEEEFSRLVSQYQQQLLNMCTMYLHDESAAEDAVQETFLKAYRSLGGMSGDISGYALTFGELCGIILYVLI